ncbi:MAG: hypothetical protein VB143_00470 [Burkholderia sp.]
MKGALARRVADFVNLVDLVQAEILVQVSRAIRPAHADTIAILARIGRVARRVRGTGFGLRLGRGGDQGQGGGAAGRPSSSDDGGGRA